MISLCVDKYTLIEKYWSKAFITYIYIHVIEVFLMLIHFHLFIKLIIHLFMFSTRLEVRYKFVIHVLRKHSSNMTPFYLTD